MKSVALASALVASVLVGITSGRPFINKRALVTEVIYVTETVANVAVYVDENGIAYSTTTEAQVTSAPSVEVTTSSLIATTTSESAIAATVASSSPLPTPPAASSSASPLSDLPESSIAPSSVEVDQAPTSVVYDMPASSAAAAPTITPPPAPTTAGPAPPPQASPSDVPANKNEDNGDSLGMGITYDFFTGTHDNSACKSDQQVAEEFEKMKDYSVVRVYGMSCNQIALAVQNAAKHNQKLMAGIYLSKRGGGESISDTIWKWKEALEQHNHGDWSMVALFSVANERVNEGDMTVSDVVDAIRDARGQLRNLGYNGPVGTVDTVPATIDNPSLCEESDVVMVNCHAFFDTNTAASDAGSFVKSQVERVKTACNNKRVVVTESGWPHQGNANGGAVPSPENQAAALKSIRENFNKDMFLFNAFDSNWKSDTASTFNAEQYWGIM
ncbi:glycoside hydrolase superfamily [Ampelomyces quisqualis]|uniref:Glycoside hydrolase superfamily n=1 Tax=Ampelomyces quisqualis TaxID=50730 RepID=A0A6A5R348_AMPQU|nr:glycoside hydrolase superfamily [Ampelomyces quisqualis]